MSPDNRHKFALPYWARPGIVSFAKHDSGGGKDDEDEDGVEGDDDDLDDDEDDDDPDEGKSAEELATELKAVRDRLKKANGSSAKRRKQLREREAELEQLRNKGAKSGKSKDDDDEPVDLDAIREAAKREAVAEATKLRKADKAEVALSRAGVDPARLGKAVKLIASDLEDVTLEDDGTLDGFDDVLDSLKAEWPELFVKKRKRGSVAGEHDDGTDDKGKTTPKGASDAQARVLTRRGR